MVAVLLVLGDDVVETIVHDTLPTAPEDGSACGSTRSMQLKRQTHTP
jgi:hypothetical protein